MYKYEYMILIFVIVLCTLYIFNWLNISGFFLLFLAMNINDWLVFTEDPNTTFLTLMFFCLNFLAATQDIAVDGWALTMLRKLVLTCWHRFKFFN